MRGAHSITGNSAEMTQYLLSTNKSIVLIDSFNIPVLRCVNAWYKYILVTLYWVQIYCVIIQDNMRWLISTDDLIFA